MNAVIYFFGSGAAFFVGVAGVLSSATMFQFTRRTDIQRIATLLAALGLVLVGLSATPLPYAVYALGGVASLAWIYMERSVRLSQSRHRDCFRAGVMVFWVVTASLEARYQLPPSLATMGRPTLTLYADSVTAGMGETNLSTWPRLLADQHGVVVFDHSQAGATVKSMLRIADKSPPADGLILLEIGGNDLLGNTSASEFERDLDRLLASLSGPGRTVLMVELPLPPLANAFGRAQRQLSAVHGVLLIPKRLFVGVLTTSGATIDGIHLTRAGQAQMADVMWQCIRGAFSE